MATITVQEVHNIASCERPKGMELLRQALGWTPFDEADDQRKAILLDFHYDNLMYCIQKGFAWQQIGTLVAMAAEVADKCKGKRLTEGVQIYHRECRSSCGSISEQNLKLFTEFFFETFMRHYQLYQYVLTTPQDPRTIKVCAEVETPVEPLPFTDSKQWKLWDYEQKLKVIELEEEKIKEGKEAEKLRRLQEQEEKLTRAVGELQNAEHPLEKEAIVAMINEIASHHVTAASHSIKSHIEDTITDLEFMLQKTSLARPQELGPPTRHKTKTPLSGGKRPKSTLKDKTQAPSRGSAKAKAK